ncbi:type III restriction enzyme [Microcella alkaliphila]|uniref:Type III restriction enzyme n=1 Tax=Microcella alkaliphila TaxID=279828 RepID=A0A4Q7TA98_9MICO|nr:DEAD/DEAH box helicase family protein [Microcella alkaliphila]RZT55948.1 type III restriction enzyme [Microcella alkaliphila]
MTWIAYDEYLVDEITTCMDLRKPNAVALGAVAEAIEEGDGAEVVCDLATGVGKTYLAGGLIEYLARNGVRNMLFVTPGTTIYEKTIANFTPGSRKYVAGATIEPLLITAENFARGQVGDALHDAATLKLFVFNVQQLIKPTANTSRKVRADDEFIGDSLYHHLRAAKDLVIIADEHHVYRSSAAAFSAAIRDLSPRALVGLTATPDPADLDKVIYRYSLAEAIADRLVKVPVVVYRQDGLKDIDTQLADAAHLRALREPAWHAYADQAGRERVSPVLFVVCQTIEDASLVAEKLTVHLPDEGQVLLVTSQSSDTALAALADVEKPESPVRAIVSVDKLKEGWDVKNIGVIVGHRALASQTLTEQILGRGLRLPFGERTGIAAVDHVDVVAHESYTQLLRSKDSLLERVATVAPTGAGLAGSTTAAPVTVEMPDGVIRVTPGAIADGSGAATPGDHLGGLSEADLLIVQPIDASAEALNRDAEVLGQHLPAVPGRPRIVFPRRDRELQPIPFSLERVSLGDVRVAAQQYRVNYEVSLQGQAIVAERDLENEVNVTTQAVEGVTATQNYVTAAAVRHDLVRRIMDLGLVPQQLTEKLHAESIADEFLGAAGVTDAEVENWTLQRAAQATAAIAALVRAAYDRNDRQPAFRWNPVELLQPRVQPSVVHPWYSEFVVGQWYGEWSKSAEAAASFDSKTAEFAFATLIDQSDGVAWWLRLYQPDGAYITRMPSGRYYPDFIVIDDEGVHWLVETKSDAAAANDLDVAAKKRAAEDWAVEVNDSRSFGTWRYALITESHIRAAPNWRALLHEAGAD